MIKDGRKTIEDRPLNLARKRHYGQVKPGDLLICVSLETKERLEKKVNWVKIYKSVREMADNEPVEKIIPGVKTADELVAIFEQLKRKWGHRYAYKLEHYGIVAMGIGD
jgi:ASC-1-like (ASCH) protein